MAKQGRSARKTILIIDDDADFRLVMSHWFKDRGWQVIEAPNGETGLELAKLHKPHVLLCDLLMPKVNGFQVCRSIRAEPRLRHTKIIVTSGRDFESDRLAALDAGADDYLVKPISPGQIVAALDSAAGKATTSKKKQQNAVQARPATTTLRFWGVRGTVPTPGPSTVLYGGNTTCLEVRTDGQIIVLDAGTGLRLLGQALEREFGAQPLELTVLLTHTHWDHIHGLPYFTPIYNPKNHIRILGYEGARKGLNGILSGQMEGPYFPIKFERLPGNIMIEELRDMEFSLGRVRVRAHFAHHPGICVGYRLFTPHGSIAFFPDNELRHSLRRAQQSSRKTGAPVPLHGQNTGLLKFLRGVDVLILDAQYTAAEYEQHIGWGHGCVDDAVALALRSRAKQLFLFHHDPDHDDAQISRMAEHARRLVAKQKGSLKVEAAREGMSVTLPLK